VFRNAGAMKFDDVSRAAGPFFEVKSVGRGAAFADYDNDGKVDVFIVNLGSPAFLLHNTSPGANHWITVKLVGHKSNRDGIGAQVEVAAGGSSTSGWLGRAICRPTIRASISGWARRRRSKN